MLSGALMANAEELLRMGLSPTEVAEGYETACEKALKILPGVPGTRGEGRVGVGERREGQRERKGGERKGGREGERERGRESGWEPL